MLLPIIIFDCGIKDEVVDAVQLQICQFNNFSLQVKNIEFWLEKHKEPLKTKNYWSAATYGRFAIPELCKGYGKVIYADVDMIFNRDIGELIEINLGSNYIAGVLDITEECRRYIEPKHAQYLRQELELNEENVCINAGLLLINVAVWREQDLAEKALALLKRKSFHLLDQDALCSLCRGKIYVLEDAWNNLAWPKTYIDKLKIKSDNKNIPYLTAIINNYLQAYSSDKVIFHYNTREKPWKYIKTGKQI